MKSNLRAIAIGLVFVSSFAAFSGDSWAQKPFEPREPENYELVDFYLLTVGRGDELYQRYGHTVIRMIDWQGGFDLNFNWGMFDFRKPGFLKNFYQGHLRYHLGIQSYRSLVDLYGDHEHRALYQERLNLTTEQKKKLTKKIFWNAKPENREYSYHMYYDNCSTRPRDYLDEIFGGAIKERFGEALTDRTFRDHFREAMSGLPLILFGADITHNSLGDFKLTKWQEMFLPSKLRQYLMEMPALDDQGRERLGEKLLTDTVEVLNYPDPKPGYDGYWLFGFVLFLPGVLLLTKRPWIGALGFFVWGLIAGTFGFTMTVNWIFSGHEVLKHNANLWLFWPTDYFFCWLSVRILRRGLPQAIGPVTKVYLVTHVVAFCLMILLYLGGLIDQNVAKVILYLGPAGLVLWGLSLSVILGKGRDHAEQHG